MGSRMAARRSQGVRGAGCWVHGCLIESGRRFFDGAPILASRVRGRTVEVRRNSTAFPPIVAAATADNRHQPIRGLIAMIDRLDEMMKFQSDALNLRAQRQTLLAANIANADTPNYKAVDFDFAKALAGALASGGGGAATADAQKP
jgi:hypothetical protein